MPEADALVGSFRERHFPREVAARIPPHVTILFPFAPADLLDDELLDAVRAHVGRLSPFEAELAAVGAFDEHVWLAPEPRERFVELIRETCAGFPKYPSYGGDVEEHVPHLTVGEAAPGRALADIVEAAVRELAPRLPLPFRVRAVSVLVEQDDGTWHAALDCPLGA